MSKLLCVLLLQIAIIIILPSCTGSNSTSPKLSFTDSMEVERRVDSMVDATMKSAYFDTANIASSPIVVTSAKLFKRDYSNYKDIRLAYKNVSGKDISAVRFRWYGETAFGDPADMGNYSQEGFGGGFDDGGLRKGKTSSGEWSILSKNGKKVVKAWATEVVFEDGTKWEAKN